MYKFLCTYTIDDDDDDDGDDRRLTKRELN